jgi:hypothetical protein
MVIAEYQVGQANRATADIQANQFKAIVVIAATADIQAKKANQVLADKMVSQVIAAIADKMDYRVIVANRDTVEYQDFQATAEYRDIVATAEYRATADIVVKMDCRAIAAISATAEVELAATAVKADTADSAE